ncbi:MAG: glycosyltransferase family 39 protein [Abitibacteriaceae bacterium]|nr:glycosyltransferase family 39 protein [Abditibacteriaceae bacterium]
MDTLKQPTQEPSGKKIQPPPPIRYQTLQPSSYSTPSWLRGDTRRTGAICYGILMLAALVIGCYHLSITGTLWPDGPQYANAGAMIHDWILSGDKLHPMQFAQEAYAQYPAFHLPFHPPVYPSLLALCFLVTGISYDAARILVALLFGMGGCCFHAILRRLGTRPGTALACALLFLTTPEIAHWARDTMSEVPALALFLAGSYFFVTWLETRNPWHCLAAFALAEMAFLSRVTILGLIPTWVLFTLLSGQMRRWRAPLPILLLGGYFVFNALWIKWVSRYAKYETFGDNSVQGSSHPLAANLPTQQISFYATHFPAMAGGGLMLLGLGAAFVVLRHWPKRQENPAGTFWLSWLVSYVAFLLATHLVPEQRYFVLALPALAGLVATLLRPTMDVLWSTRLVPALIALSLALNLLLLGRIPRGVLGYRAVAQETAELPAPGNILSAVWMSQDFIFRYWASRSPVKRSIIRADRTLAIRLSDYGGFANRKVKSTVLAHSRADVIHTLRRGRIRYLLTCAPLQGKPDSYDPEMVLAHEVARSTPQQFSLIRQFPLLEEFEEGHLFEGRIYLWKFNGPLPPGPSDLPVVVPTADMVLKH